MHQQKTRMKTFGAPYSSFVDIHLLKWIIKYLVLFHVAAQYILRHYGYCVEMVLPVGRVLIGSDYSLILSKVVEGGVRFFSV